MENLKPSEKIHTRGEIQNTEQYGASYIRPTTLVNSNKLQFRILRTELSGKNLNLEEKLKNPRYTSWPFKTAIYDENAGNPAWKAREKSSI